MHENNELRNCTLVLFGAGKNGIQKLTNLRRRSIYPKYFIDNNPNAQAGIDIPVYSPEILLNEDKPQLKIIITPNVPYYKDILNQIRKMGLGDCILFEESTYSRLSMVRIEASTYCQLKCVDCSSHKPNNGWILGRGNLKYSDFKNFIDNHSYIKTIELSNRGEIFLNPELTKIIEYAHKKNVALTANSGVNFNTVSDEALEALVKYKFTSMTIGIDGVSQETYSAYRVNGNYDRLIGNIKKLNSHKEQYGSEFPKLYWQFVVMQHNEDDVVKAREEAKKLNMDINYKLTWNPNYKPQKTEYVKAETGLMSITRAEYKKANNKNYVASICNQLWDSPQINWDGRLLGCCKTSRNDFGVNVFEIGLENALNTESYLYAKKLLQGKVAPQNDISHFQRNVPCINCDLYKEMVKDNSFLEIE